VKSYLLLPLLASVLLGQSESGVYSYSGFPVPISYSTNDGSVIEIRVPRALSISKVAVRLQIDYPQVGDLNVFLYSPFGTRSRLLERNCGALTNIDTTFDDAADVNFGTFCPVEAGRGPFRSNDPLSNFNGQTSFGIWRLYVQNSGSAERVGSLRTFSLTITGVPQTGPIITPDTVTGAASGRSGSIAPGELLNIYGVGLGPATPVVAPAGENLPGTLGGTSVIIDGIQAGMVYSSESILQVQVPYGEIPGTYALIQIRANGGASSVISMYVRTAKPGIYTTGFDGRQAKAVNENGQLNSSSNPAPKGSVVVLYANGLGLTDPLISSGVLVPNTPLFYTFYPVNVYVGGLQAEVFYSGLAPGFVGVYQLNIRIPADAPPGPNEINIVAVNGMTSQPNVSIAVE